MTAITERDLTAITEQDLRAMDPEELAECVCEMIGYETLAHPNTPDEKFNVYSVEVERGRAVILLEFHYEQRERIAQLEQVRAGMPTPGYPSLRDLGDTLAVAYPIGDDGFHFSVIITLAQRAAEREAAEIAAESGSNVVSIFGGAR